MTWSILFLCLSGLCGAATLWLLHCWMVDVDRFWQTYDD